MGKNVTNTQEREELIGWCTLLSSYNESYFERMSDDKLKETYKKLSQER